MLFWFSGRFSKREAYVNDFNITIPSGSISDISDLALLKNAREIFFEANQVSDITPLYKIKLRGLSP